MRRYLNILAVAIACLAVFVLSTWITLTWVTSGKTILVPDLREKNVVDALKEVGQLGLDIRIVQEEYHPVIPRNGVISQSPRAGTALKVDRNIQVVLSRGMRNVAVPDVRAMPLRKAELILSRSGLSPDRVTRAYAPDAEADTVLAQNPMPGATDVRENTVNLLVSSGSRLPGYRMPDLVGTPYEQAVAFLESAGLVIANVRYEEYPGVVSNQVTNQSPPFGYPVNRDSEIFLVVNRQEAAAPAATVHRVPFSYRLPFGFFPVGVDVFLEDRQGRRRIYSERRFPGSLVKLTVEVSGPALIEVYQNNKKIHVRDYPGSHP